MVSTWRRRLPARPKGEAVLGEPLLVGQSPEGLAADGGTRAYPAPQAPPRRATLVGLTCDPRLPVVPLVPWDSPTYWIRASPIVV